MDLQPNTHVAGLPKYIYTINKDRAYLTITADVYGKWSAGYHLWGKEVRPGVALYSIYGPFVKDCTTMDAAILKLGEEFELLKEAN